MVEGIQAGFMPICAGIVSTKPTQRPEQVIRERLEYRQLVREEMRFNELNKKARTGELTNEEKAELAFLKANRLAEKMLLQPKVVYVA